jgi:hypothetical protein
MKNTVLRNAVALSLLLLLAGTLGLSGCKGGTVTPIGDLLSDPGHFDRHEVVIEGTVAEAVGVLGYGAYQIEDGTGKLMVVTREAGAPRVGAHIGVRGEFRSAYTVGDLTGAVLVERQRKLL